MIFIYSLFRLLSRGRSTYPFLMRVCLFLSTAVTVSQLVFSNRFLDNSVRYVPVGLTLHTSKLQGTLFRVVIPMNSIVYVIISLVFNKILQILIIQMSFIFKYYDFLYNVSFSLLTF